MITVSYSKTNSIIEISEVGVQFPEWQIIQRLLL